MELLFLLLAVAGLWLWFRSHRRKRAAKASDAFDRVSPLLAAHDIDVESAVFSFYDDPTIMRRSGLTVFVGVGTYRNGQSCGFVVEVDEEGRPGELQLLPPGVASHHKAAARAARAGGSPMMENLEAMNREYLLR